VAAQLSQTATHNEELLTSQSSLQSEVARLSASLDALKEEDKATTLQVGQFIFGYCLLMLTSPTGDRED
jgi:hypothetical protein